MTGRSRDAKPRSLARGTPPIPKTYAWIWDKAADGRIWEIHPNDHHIKPRRFYLETRNYFAQLKKKAMIVKRDRMIYIQVLDEDVKKDDQTVYALSNRMPYVQRWLLPTQEEPESPPDPGEENDVPVRKKMRPRGSAGAAESKRYVPARQLEAYVLAVMNRYFDKSMTVKEITRVADYLLREAPEERFAHVSQVRLCLQKLVADENTPVFGRMATDQESAAMGFKRGVTHLYSPTDPVPRWTNAFHEDLLYRYPNPRIAPAEVQHKQEIPPAFRRVPPEPQRVIIEQPSYTVTTHRGSLPMTQPESPKPHPPAQQSINGVPLIERVAGMSKDLAQLAADLKVNRHSADARLAKENADLRAANYRLQEERDTAVNQLQAIANAQQQMSEIFRGLGGS